MEWWNERYTREPFAYGKEPNDFLKEFWSLIPMGKVLCLAEGEGRNAVFLAKQGYQVTAVDQSRVGLAKAQTLAAENGVEIKTAASDLKDFVIQPGDWQGIVSIWAHIPRLMRDDLHKRSVAGLVSGGLFLLEAYSPQQLGKGTGGPPDLSLLMDLAEVRLELSGLNFVHSLEKNRPVIEGKFHNGMGSVIQIVGKKP
ncbi:MAG: methyltransferase domain-containing protein [Elusimicrobia bacterium]|jgi:SAM-dependent methyltransferase|nr:methyltransferase domain-containing protein [Elusimicrobiota bacterium]